MEEPQQFGPSRHPKPHPAFFNQDTVYPNERYINWLLSFPDDSDLHELASNRFRRSARETLYAKGAAIIARGAGVTLTLDATFDICLGRSGINLELVSGLALLILSPAMHAGAAAERAMHEQERVNYNSVFGGQIE